MNVEEFISIKGFKAIGNQLSSIKIKAVKLEESLPYEEEKAPELEKLEVNDPETLKEDPPQISLDF